MASNKCVCVCVCIYICIYLADVGGDEVADKGLGVGVDGPAFLHGVDDGDEVVVRQHLSPYT